MSFRNPTTLLASADASLIEVVTSAIESIGNLDLEVISGVDATRERLTRDDVALVLVHQDCVKNVAETTRLLRTIAEAKRSVPVLALSNQHRGEQALALLRAGAADYLSRPLDLGRLTYLMNVLTLRARLVRPPAAPANATDPAAPDPIQRVGDADPFFYQPGTPMGRQMEQVRRVATQDTTVLLGGETGTGKTRLARLIHELSPRCGHPFLVVNCGALSATLIESEMFGHIKGAFTGADRDHTGKFAAVGRGTLLLDDIDALPLALQAKLLRVVEDRIFELVGSNKAQPVHARLIAASNRPLDQEAAAGRFRPDLYYRLNVISFHLPPLRDRRPLVPALVSNFIAEYAARSGREVDGIAPEALRALLAYEWPGNVRELRNTIEGAVVLCPGREIQVEDLPERFHHLKAAAPALPTTRAAAVSSPTSAATLAGTKEAAEVARITDALERHQNNRLRAAAELGISRMTLYKKLHRYGLMGT